MQARLRHFGLHADAVWSEEVGVARRGADGAREGVAMPAAVGAGAGAWVGARAVTVAGTGAGSLSCRMELMKVVGERGVSWGTVPTSTSTGHTSSTSESWVVGLDGSSLMWTSGLVLSLLNSNKHNTIKLPWHVTHDSRRY